MELRLHRTIRLLALFATSGLASAQTSAAPLEPPSASAPGNESAAPTLATVPADTRDLLPEIPPIPKGDISLIGGTIRTLDRVRDQMAIQVAGGPKEVVLFDPRTHVYREDARGTLRDLELGQHVYVDTLLDGKDVFAKNIHIVSSESSGQSSGQVVEHAPGATELTVRDVLSQQPIKFRLDRNSVVMRGGRRVSADEMIPGTLVRTEFSPDRQGQIFVRQISILAVPGSTFYFSGQVVHLDVSRGLLVVVDPRDRRSYDLRCDPSLLRARSDLHEGVQVTVTTIFEGSQYTAKAITVSSANKQ